MNEPAFTLLLDLLGQSDLVRLADSIQAGQRVWIDTPDNPSLFTYIDLISTVFRGRPGYWRGDEEVRFDATRAWVRVTSDGCRPYGHRPDIDTDGVWRCDLHLIVPTMHTLEGEPAA
ncbi:hypothetical protein [Nocardia thailandica]|uniref:hypothetical protein n=1 Tax=Nocardia thailandica TaxID=257275 RepID=UPI0002EC450B|nr:hypothetical protein [Nocardia thailandica]